jgi:hypothetical protein
MVGRDFNGLLYGHFAPPDSCNYRAYKAGCKEDVEAIVWGAAGRSDER